MTVIEFPRRARGGRGPQIGDHTFEVRTADTAGKPSDFSGIAWSPGPGFPGVELWCLHTTDYKTVAPDQDDHHMWLDKSSVQFNSPNDDGPDDPQTIAALRAFARGRYLGSGGNTDSDWEVRIGRPFAAATVTPTKLKVGVENADPIYCVTQSESAGSPVSWVWPRWGGAHEVWLYHLPDQPGGFRVPGNITSGTSTPLDSTELRFRLMTDHFDPGGPSYSADIAGFMNEVLQDQCGEVASIEELVLHHQRIERV